MKEYTLHSPAFTLSETNKKNLPEIKYLLEEIESLLLGSLHMHGPINKDSFCLVLIRQDIGNNDYQYDLAIIPIKNADGIYVTGLPKDRIKDLPVITIGIDKDSAPILNRIVNNKAFL